MRTGIPTRAPFSGSPGSGAAPSRRSRVRRLSLGLLWLLLGLVAFAVVCLALALLLVPTLAAPTSDFVMAPDPARLEQLQRRVEETAGRLLQAPGEPTPLVVEAADLNAILARALAGASGERGLVVDRARVVLTPGRVRLEGAFAFRGAGVPGYLRDRSMGLVLRVAPRVDDGRLVLGVIGAQLGRVPLPVGLLLRVARAQALLPPEIEVDATARAVRVALPDLGPPDLEGLRIRLVGLTVEEGRILLDLRLAQGS